MEDGRHKDRGGGGGGGSSSSSIGDISNSNNEAGEKRDDKPLFLMLDGEGGGKKSTSTTREEGEGEGSLLNTSVSNCGSEDRTRDVLMKKSEQESRRRTSSPSFSLSLSVPNNNREKEDDDKLNGDLLKALQKRLENAETLVFECSGGGGLCAKNNNKSDIGDEEKEEQQQQQEQKHCFVASDCSDLESLGVAWTCCRDPIFAIDYDSGHIKVANEAALEALGTGGREKLDGGCGFWHIFPELVSVIDANNGNEGERRGKSAAATLVGFDGVHKGENSVEKRKKTDQKRSSSSSTSEDRKKKGERGEEEEGEEEEEDGKSSATVAAVFEENKKKTDNNKEEEEKQNISFPETSVSTCRRCSPPTHCRCCIGEEEGKIRAATEEEKKQQSQSFPNAAAAPAPNITIHRDLSGGSINSNSSTSRNENGGGAGGGSMDYLDFMLRKSDSSSGGSDDDSAASLERSHSNCATLSSSASASNLFNLLNLSPPPPQHRQQQKEELASQLISLGDKGMMFSLKVKLLLVGSGRKKFAVISLRSASMMGDDMRRDTIKQTKQLLAASEQAMSYVCHELRNPMHAVLASVELLRHSDATIPAEDLDALENGTQQMLALINDVLDYNKLRAGKLEIKDEAVQVRPLLRSLCTQYHSFARVPIVCDISDNSPLCIVTDSARLRQVLSNGLTNAIKFTAEGQITLGVSVLPDRSRIRFTIDDTGSGIGNRDPQSLFQPFITTSATPVVGHSTGLGLSISKDLVTGMGGAIGLLPLSRGTRFWVELPFRLVEMPESSPRPSLPKQNVVPLPMHVLFVDDNRTLQRIGERMLASIGATCLVLEDGDMVEEAIKLASVDAILMDLYMGRSNGADVVKNLRATGVTLPVIAMTGESAPGKKKELLAAGFDLVITKPFTLQTLHAALLPFAKKKESS